MTSWSRQIWASSVTVGSWLYIDGGEIARGSYSDNATNLSLLTNTLSIDLSKPWTAANVTINSIEKPPGCPSLNHQALLFNRKDGAVYSFGGEATSQPPFYFVPEPLSVWKLVPDGHGGGSWSIHLTASEPPFSEGVLRPMGGSFASGKEEALYLGGFSSGGTSSQTTNVGYVPLPGLMTVDFANQKFRNISAAGYSTYSTSAWGGMHYIPMLDPNGVYIMIGGDTPSPWSYTYGDSKRKMDNITVYEPVTRQWFHQTTTGDEIPTPREHFCIVGMGENASGSFEIFIYAGYDGIGRPPSPKYDEIWVLTLPAFHYQKANYTSTHSRHGHTCSVIGDRYIFTYGCREMLKSNFWGEVRRKSYFAAPYVRPNSFNYWYAANGLYPQIWDQPELKDLLQNKILPPASPSYSNQATSIPVAPSNGSSSNQGPLIGGVVGGVCGGLLFFAAAVIFFRRLHQSRSKSSSRTGNEDQIVIQELRTSANTWELHTSANTWELEGNTCDDTGGTSASHR